MAEILKLKEKDNDKITIKELAEVFKCSEELIKTRIREIYPNLMVNGKTTYLTKEQVIKIKIELEKSSNSITYQNFLQVKVTGENTAKIIEQTKEFVFQLGEYLKAMELENKEKQQEINQLTENNLQLAEELHYAEEEAGIKVNYQSFRNIAILNNCSEKEFNWRKLKEMSKRLNLEIIKISDPRFGQINLYHKAAWKACYPDIKID
jgi:uncharacterized protein YqfB (UPF0267 family)